MNRYAVSLANMTFSIAPADALDTAELAFLHSLERPQRTDQDPVRVDLLPTPLKPAVSAPEFGEPAAITTSGETVNITHRDFNAEIEPSARTVRLYRKTSNAFPLQLTLRTALGCVLPLESGFVLHSAGVIIDGAAYVFFGRSGAGKSTLASLSPFPLLSDEHVVIRKRECFTAQASGAWGTFEGTAARGEYPLRALVQLDRGPQFRLDPVDRRAAVSSLIGVTHVQPLRELWQCALIVISELSRTVPVWRMQWTPSEAPWERLRAEVR